MSLVLVNISLQAREHFACLMHANTSKGKENIIVKSAFISLRVWRGCISVKDKQAFLIRIGQMLTFFW